MVMLTRNCGQEKRWCIVVALLAVVLGCQRDPLGRQTISGNVTLDGVPLTYGSITFEPQQSKSTSSGAMIQEGSYAIAQAKGLPPGKYLVRISKVKPADTKNIMPGQMSPTGFIPGTELVPPRYNSQSGLTVTVTADGPNRFDFELKSR